MAKDAEYYRREREKLEQAKRDIQGAIASGAIKSPAAASHYNDQLVSAEAALDQDERLNNPDKNTGFEYRNTAGAADADINRYRGLGEEAGNRKIKADYDQANQTRGYQGEALGLYRDAAMGKGPSAAQAQFQGSLDQSLRAGQATANSARGGALGLAQARLAAAREGGEMLSDATSKAAALRAQEMQAAMGGYAGLGTQMRGQDEGRSVFNADLSLRDRTANDSARIAYEGLGQGVAGMQQTGALVREQLIAGQAAQAAGTAARGDAARKAEGDRAAGIVSTVSSIVPGVAGAVNGANSTTTAGTPTTYTGSNAGSVATNAGLGGAAAPKPQTTQAGQINANPTDVMGYQGGLDDKRPRRWG